MEYTLNSSWKRHLTANHTAKVWKDTPANMHKYAHADILYTRKYGQLWMYKAEAVQVLHYVFFITCYCRFVCKQCPVSRRCCTTVKCYKTRWCTSSPICNTTSCLRCVQGRSLRWIRWVLLPCIYSTFYYEGVANLLEAICPTIARGTRSRLNHSCSRPLLGRGGSEGALQGCHRG